MGSTQKDIARRLGISTSLVSRVLSGRAHEIGAGEDTIERVRRVAAELNYVPNVAARVLKGAPSRTLGVIVYDFEDPFFAPILGELLRLGHRTDYSLTVVGFERRQVRERDLLPLWKHGVDGLIIVGSGSETDWKPVIAGRDLPAVRIGSGPSAPHLASVHVDSRAGVRALVRHLAERGHRRIGFVGSALDVHRHRYDDFRAAVAEAGVETDKRWAGFSSAAVTEAGGPACRELLARSRGYRPTALVASSDAVALGAMRHLFAHGLRVPQDLSMVGFDDLPLARLVTPALTTVRQPVRAMARRAFELVTAGPGSGARAAEAFAPTLVVRESTAAPPAAGQRGAA